MPVTATGEPDTVTAHVAVLPLLLVAVIVAVPELTPVTTPVTLFTVAQALSLDQLIF